MQKVEVKIIATDNNYNMNLQQPSLIYINNIVWCKFKITNQIQQQTVIWIQNNQSNQEQSWCKFKTAIQLQQQVLM